MFNVGGPEIMVIILVALVVLGPEQLPKAMRTFGNVMGEIRKVSSGFQAEMRSAMNTLEESDGTAASAAPAATSPSPADGDVTEIVARNVDPTPPAAEATGVVAERSSAADRAAG